VTPQKKQPEIPQSKSPKNSDFSSEMEIPEKQRVTQKTKPEVKSQTNPSQCLEKREERFISKRVNYRATKQRKTIKALITANQTCRNRTTGSG